MRTSEMTPETESQAQIHRAGPRPTTAFHPGMDGTRVFDERPILIYWETTLACDLACQHCRAEAQREPHPYQLSPEEIKRTSVGHGFGIRDGNGIMVVSHTGDVYPTGFLPYSAGNVRQTSPVEIYRDSQLFNDLRDPDRFGGDCGECEYRYICGGSRARAFAGTGDPLAADPLCPYQPRGGEVVT